MRLMPRTPIQWLLALLALAALATVALWGEVQWRRGPHGLEAVQVYDEEFTLTDAVDDGPYVAYVDGGLEARWVCAGRVERQRLPAGPWPVRLAPRCGFPHALEIHPPPAADAQASLAGVRRWVALSDVHGQYELMMRLLQAQGVIGEDGGWRYGDGHLVLVGDVFDRGPRATEALWQLYRLEHEARAAGGAVHMLLGNHEILVLRDDLRYLSGKYVRSARLLGEGYAALHGPGTVLGDWLRAKRTLLRIDDTVFMHAGAHASFVGLGLPLEEGNRLFRESLGQPRDAVLADPVLGVLHGTEGPVWYRGYFLDESLAQAEVERGLRALGAARIVVGHTSMPTVLSLHGGRVIGVDSSIKKGRAGELLHFEDGVFSRGLLDGRRLPLEPAPPAGLP